MRRQAAEAAGTTLTEAASSFSSPPCACASADAEWQKNRIVGDSAKRMEKGGGQSGGFGFTHMRTRSSTVAEIEPYVRSNKDGSGGGVIRNSLRINADSVNTYVLNANVRWFASKQERPRPHLAFHVLVDRSTDGRSYIARTHERTDGRHAPCYYFPFLAFGFTRRL
jgi:hypothetical protein